MGTKKRNLLPTLVPKRLATATALTIFCLLISACAPGAPVKSVEVSETATISATSTAEATPTNTIEPTAIPGGIVTDSGIVFVENGAVRLSKDGVVSEVQLSEVVFNTTADASRIVYELLKAEFDNQNLVDWYPGKLESDTWYKNTVESSASLDDEGGAKNIDIAGIVVEFA